MIRQHCEALLVDLDGVLRVFDPGHAAAVEERYGLPDGVLAKAAFAADPLRRAVTGRITHDEWMAEVAEALGVPDGAAAVADWSAYRGTVQPDVLAAIREIRAGGTPIGLVSNATDRLDADLDRLGLHDEVDAVVNSSVVGYAKPSPELFQTACAAVGVPPARCLLVDDDARNVAGARAAGLAAYRYAGTADLRYIRAAVRAAGQRPATG